MYDMLDFNLAQSVLSTASGRALDLMGELYNIKRKTIGTVAADDQRVGAFYFYIDNPQAEAITIPAGARVFTDPSGYVGRQLAFIVAQEVTIPAGSTRAYAQLNQDFAESIFTAAAGTLTSHNVIAPTGVTLRCTNPKPIAATEGYELDDQYRIRIMKGIRVASSGTLEAIRFAGLNIAGVRDIRVRQAPYGMGSFEVVVVPEETRFANALSTQVLDTLNTVRPVGVTMFMKEPTLIPLDLSFFVVSDRTSSPEYDTLTTRTQLAVMRYLNSLLPGDSIIYNKLIQSIFDASAIIKDVQITKYAPNGVEAIRRNYTPQEIEQIVPGRIESTIS